MDIDFDIAPDSFDEVVLPASVPNTTGLGKFKPKPRGKTAKPIASAPQPISASSEPSGKLFIEEDAHKLESLDSVCSAVHEDARQTEARNLGQDEIQDPKWERSLQTDPTNKALRSSPQMELHDDAYSQSCTRTTADVAFSNSIDCLDEIFLPPVTARAQPLGKFQPKRHGKTTKLGTDAPPSVTSSLDPRDTHVPEETIDRPDRPEPLGSKAVACDAMQEEILQIEDGNLGLDNPQVSEGEKGRRTDSDVSEEALPECSDLESRDDIYLQACSADAVIPISTECPDDLFFPPSTNTARALDKFQPKRHGKTKKSVTDAPPSVTFSLDSSCILVTEKIVDQPEPPGSKVEACNAVQEEVLQTEDENLVQENSQVSEKEMSLGIDSDKPEEAMPVLSVEACDDFFSQFSDTAVEQVGNFHGNSISRPKERKKKRVSFILPDAAETAASVETHPMALDGHLTREEPSLAQMTNSEFLDKIPFSTSILSDNIDFQLDDGSLGSQDLADFSGLESFDSILDVPTTVSEQSVGRLRPKASAKFKSLTSDASGHNDKGSTSSEWRSFSMNEDSLESLNLSEAFDSPIHLDKQADTDEISMLASGSAELNEALQSVDQTSVLVEPSIPKASEDHEASKTLRKRRKRTNICNPGKHDDGASEDLVIRNSNNSQMDVDNDDDEYTCGEMPKQKAPRRSKKQKPEAQEPAQRRKRAPKDPDSAKTEPPQKRFPHGTRRRRQVDKVLLETPDYEIDPKQLKIKDLIMLAEAKERISSKGGESLMTNQSDTGAFSKFFDEDNSFDEDPDPSSYEEHRNILRNSKKLNYHTYMNKPQSGRWSKSETELFFKAIREFGTDFAMIQQLFPDRTRHQVKLKFKNEERKHPKELADAITHRSQDHSNFERVIQQLQAKADEESRLDDVFGDSTNLSLDGTNENQEEQGAPEKEEDTSINFDGKANNSEEFGDWDAFDGEANNSEKHGEWDADKSEKYDDWNGVGTSEYDDLEELDWG